MKIEITNSVCIGDGLNYSINAEGTLRTFKQKNESNGVSMDTILIMIEGKPSKLNSKQAFALFALVYALNTKGKSFEIPEISGGFTTWDEITELAK
jgi:hypothetical protein